MKHKHKIWNIILPGCKTAGCEYDNTLIWLDDRRPEPTESEMLEELTKLELELSEKQRKAEAKILFEESIGLGVVHSNNIYPCDLEFINYMNIINNSDDVNNNFNNDKNIVMPKKNGELNTLTVTQFKNLFAKVNTYYYTLLKQYWRSL